MFRFRPEILGAHVHVRVWCAPREGVTYASVGALTMRATDWLGLRALLVHQAGGDEQPGGTIDVGTPEDPVWTTPET